MAKKIGRRTFIKTASMTAAGFTLSPMMHNAWASNPLPLYFGCPFTGAYAASAKYLLWGMELAIDHFGGKVLDRPIEIIKGNSPTPAEGIRQAKHAVENKGCKLLTVTPSSATVLAVSKYANEADVLLMGQGGSDDITGSACNRSTFRWPIPTWGAVRAVLPLVINEYNTKTFYTITPKYIFGENLLCNTRKVLDQQGCTFLGNAYHALGENNYSQTIAKAKASGAECILLLNFGNDTIKALQQAHAVGLTKKSRIACVWGAGIHQMMGVDPEIIEGVLWGLNYYHTIPTEANRAFVKAFKAKHHEFPSYLSAALYSSTMALLACVQLAGTDDPAEVINVLEGYKYAGLTGREEYRDCDHQCVKPFYVVRSKEVANMTTPHDLADIIGYSVNLQPCQENGCYMGLF